MQASPVQTQTIPGHVDVLIVGAGLSGIGAAVHLQRDCPAKRYLILEARDAIGGTWDLFRYPGIRSDSDAFTLGYNFKPWIGEKSITDGDSIRSYIRETAKEHDIDQHIRFRHKVKRLNWSSADARWQIEAEHNGQPLRLTAQYVIMGAGYYNYDHGYLPDWPGYASFKGQIVHPQFWPENLDYAGKRVLVIGSGATAMTVVPAMTDKAAHVTMLQRSPTYVASVPAKEPYANWLRRNLPAKLAYTIIRWRNVLFGMYFFNASKKRPQKVKDWLLKMVREALPAGYDVEKHFTPKYAPWDQRLCAITDGDLFEGIKAGKIDVVTDHIDTFTEKGVRLKSGQELEADIIVPATGLELQTAGGAAISVDGAPVDLGKTFIYKGMLYSDLPNFANIFGYTNASWTLKADLTSEYFCRMINYLDREGYASFTPRVRDQALEAEPFADFSSGYVQRAIDRMPKQGKTAPWRLFQNYALDILNLRFGSLNTPEMEFKRAPSAKRESAKVIPFKDAAA